MRRNSGDFKPGLAGPGFDPPETDRVTPWGFVAQPQKSCGTDGRRS
jgi:hypothetical protein